MFTLQQAIDAVEFKPEFSVKDRGEYTVIDYNLNNKETFVGENEEQSLILRNLRGTAFDNESGQIIRLAYDKFFNYGEFPESDSRLDFDDLHLITQKVDGSMVTPVYSKSGTHFATRAGSTDISQMAEKFAVKSGIAYSDFIFYCATRLWATPIFEYCSDYNRVVIAYPEEQLVLTGIRYIDSGKYESYETLKDMGQRFGIPVVKKINSIVQSEFSTFKVGVNDLQNDEGVVIRFESGINAGHMIKIKSAEYCLKHKAVDQIKYAKDLLLMSLNGLLDDMIPILSDDTAARVRVFVDDFWSAVSAKDIDILNEYSKFAEIESQKEFALAILNNPYKQFLFGIRGGKNCFDMLLKYCKVNCGTQAKCEELQKFLGMTVNY